MEKVLYVATYGDFFASFQIDNMKIWQELGCEVHCVANFTDKKYNRFTERIDDIGVKKHNLNFIRKPYSFSNVRLYRELKKLIKNENITIIDTHNPIVSILSRLAARSCKIKKVIYTVHGFFFYKGAPKKNQLIFKPIEYFMARYTDCLIVTNIEDLESARKMNIRGSVHYVHGVGVNVEEVTNSIIDIDEKRAEFNIPRDAIVISSVGECIKRKNHEAAIRAFAKLNMDNTYYIVVGDGELYGHLSNLVKELGVEHNVLLPGFREDANEILKMSDIFIFPSYQEGLSVALMQAMAAKLPVVASNIRGNIDCIDNRKGGFTVNVNDIEGMSEALKNLINSPELRLEYGKYNVEKVKQFSKKVVINENYKIFNSVLDGE